MTRTLTGLLLASMLLAASCRGSAQAQATEHPSAPQPPSAPPLVIGSGDLIEVAIFDAPELSGRFRVDQKGNVQMPLLPAIQVAGLTADETAKLIEKQYIQAEILVPEQSRATVFIAEYADQGITVTGEASSPGVYPAFGVRMLNDIMIAAGGVSSSAASKVVITRRNDPQHPVTVEYDPQANPPVIPEVQMFPGDKIFVPRAGIVYVMGNVNKPGGFLLNGHGTLTAQKAMALAGGTGRAASLKNAQLVRTLQGGQKEMITVPLDRIYQGKAPDVALKDGDVLYLPTSKGKLAAQQALSSAIGIGTAAVLYKTIQ